MSDVKHWHTHRFTTLYLTLLCCTVKDKSTICIDIDDQDLLIRSKAANDFNSTSCIYGVKCHLPTIKLISHYTCADYLSRMFMRFLTMMCRALWNQTYGSFWAGRAATKSNAWIQTSVKGHRITNVQTSLIKLLDGCTQQHPNNQPQAWLNTITPTQMFWICLEAGAVWVQIQQVNC